MLSKTLTNHTPRRTAMTIVVAVGAAAAGGLAVGAQETGQQGRYGNQQQTEREVRNLSFIRSSDLLGADIRNDVDDDLGTIEEIIVNRGTGRIEHVVIREGGFLGFGGSHVALPFEALVINPAEDSVALNVSADAIGEGEDRPLPQGWTRLEDGWEDRLDTLPTARTARQQTWDTRTEDANGMPQQRQDQAGETTELSGNITKLERKDMGNGQYWAVATIDADGEQTWVVLGPAWHVYGNDRAPIRGDTFEGTVRRGDDDYMIVDRATINGNEFRFKDDRGQHTWRGDGRTGASDDDRGQGALVLLSEVSERDAKTRESDWGQIEDSIIELSSGTVPFLVLDPDENFLGIGDEYRVVPWTIVSVGDESVVIDATKDMLTSAETLPEDVRVFTMPRNLREVYMAYEVEQPEFGNRRR
jgi:sporulation protein YlmC with PRC-barrel domain